MRSVACASLYPRLSADVRSSDDVIAQGPLQPGDRTPVHILAFADLSAAENDGGFGGVPREMAREVTEHDHARSMASYMCVTFAVLTHI